MGVKFEDLTPVSDKFRIHFYCLVCEKEVERVESAPTFEKIGLVRLTCHDRYEKVCPPWWTIDERNHPTYVVGMRGPWKVAIHDPSFEAEQEMGMFAGALGHFEQEDLRRLFEKGPDGIPQNPTHFGLHSQLYDIVNTVNNFRFPAEFWFPARYKPSSAR